MNKRKYQVLLYYKYVSISDPEKVREEQRALCNSLGLKGRIIVAQEGINGTLEGTKEDTEKYISEMEKSPLFSGINYKKSAGTGVAFPKLSVRARPEIVTAGMPELNPQQVTGKYITAAELHQWFVEKREFYIVDMRNDYEYASGHFENFIPSGLSNFFNLQEVLPHLLHLKDKTIVTVCTGGVRCEKASGFLVANGFNDVYQLKDGIQTYMEQYPNEHFKGKLYVFDKRLTIGFNTSDPSHEIVGKCDLCKKPSDTYVNCEYEMCHRHYICCSDCLDKETNYAFCNKDCKENYKNRKIKIIPQQFRVNRNLQ
jgi:UPF0176 protein